MNAKPSIGIIIAGCLFIVSGVLGFITIINTPDTFKTLQVLFLRAIWSISLIVSGIGILYLKNWARLSAIIIIGIKISLTLWNSIKDLLTLRSLSSDQIVIYFGFCLIIVYVIIGFFGIYYLSSSSVKKQFH